MILSRIEIENYKQYVGLHEIPVPAAATIGVIGVNGVGKTTLFEAIEWCLYNPSTIANKDIRPRGIGGYTRVCVTLERLDGTGRIIVERELKRATTTAAIYAVDDSGEESVRVQGTRQVSDYVSTKLIGLQHSAFVATFFTRQKELHFFGNLGDANRRREVGRLLGLETIRVAQQRIGEDRRRAADEAAVLRRQYDEQSADRDFAAERATAESAIATQRSVVVEAAERLASQGKIVGQAEERLRTLHAQRDRDAAYAQRLSVLETERRSKAAHRDTLRVELERLDARERERVALAPIAARVVTLANEIARQEAERAKFLRHRDIMQARRDLERRRDDLLTTLRATVAGVRGASAIDGWSWSDNGQAPRDVLTRLVRVIDGQDLDGAERNANDLVATLDLERDLIGARSLVTKYRDARSKIEGELCELLANGDPAARVHELEQERDATQQRISLLASERTTIEGQRDASNQLVANLVAAHFEDRCPTCARPFSEGDAELVIGSLRDRVDGISARLTAVRRESRDLEQRVNEIARHRQDAGRRADAIAALRGRVQASESHIRDQEDRVAVLANDLDVALADLGPGSKRAAEKPSVDLGERRVDPARVERAQARVITIRQLVDIRSALSGAIERFARLDDEDATGRKDLDALGAIVFDESVHRQLVIEHQAATRAETTIEQIDHDLARREPLAADLEVTNTSLGIMDAELDRLRAERLAIGFEPDALVACEAAATEARAMERSFMTAHHDAQATLRDTEHSLTTISRDQDRIQSLIVQSDARRATYDDLDQMYREFTEFERFAAGRLTPILGDFTSELVRIVTDGKYDRVEFDGNFAIRVFDGDDESFALETFSGGERDAIALAARLALSRLIGTQATNQPGFLVLDEVFGSLDRDRRTRLLELLGSLSETFEDVRQVFIISHVDDVRTSAIFDDLWRIDESPDGGSRLRSLAIGEDIGDL